MCLVGLKVIRPGMNAVLDTAMLPAGYRRVIHGRAGKVQLSAFLRGSLVFRTSSRNIFARLPSQDFLRRVIKSGCGTPYWRQFRSGLPLSLLQRLCFLSLRSDFLVELASV